MFKEYKKLNYYGKLLGIKRKWFESNKSYRHRLVYFTSAMKESPKRTMGTLKSALENANFYLDKIEIKEDFNTGKIKVIMEII